MFKEWGLLLALIPFFLTSINSASGQDNFLDGLGTAPRAEGGKNADASDRRLVQRESELRNLEGQLLQKMNLESDSARNPRSDSADDYDSRDSAEVSERAISTTPTVRTATYSAPSERRASHSVALQPASAAASPDQKLAIAESQVTILSRELETTRRGLRSAERRIEELADLVKTNSPRAAQRSASEFSYGTDREPRRSKPQEHLVPLGEEEQEIYEPTIRSRSSHSATTVGKAAVRIGPRKSESMLFLLSDSTPVVIDRRSGEWYRVVTTSGARGWVAGQSLLFDTGVPANSAVKVRAVRNKYEPTGLRY
jgi:hypothetical protein